MGDRGVTRGPGGPPYHRPASRRPRRAVRRSFHKEITEGQDVPEEVVSRVHRDLTRIHRMLGDTRAVIAALRRDPLPVRRVLDIGCGHAGVLNEVRRRLGVEVIGVDLQPPRRTDSPIRIICADAVRDALPEADVAYSICLAHHLPEHELLALIRNAGRYCRRFILVDLVRHQLPLALFRLFVAPFIDPVSSSDGCLSIRRSYTPAELRAAVVRALEGTEATFRHWVAPFRVRQVADIRYRETEQPTNCRSESP